jgi:hypothetical protein
MSPACLRQIICRKATARHDTTFRWFGIHGPLSSGTCPGEPVFAQRNPSEVAGDQAGHNVDDSI